ncbi:MAG: hypothetical protein JSS87_07680 [Acidobacteria bacterium]|nr:hypothetical protein [Acidobacteriota bacterium]
MSSQHEDQEIDRLLRRTTLVNPLARATQNAKIYNQAWLTSENGMTKTKIIGFSVLQIPLIGAAIVLTKLTLESWEDGDVFDVLVFGAIAIASYYLIVRGLANIARNVWRRVCKQVDT